MLTTYTCSICNKREAYKKVSSSIDGSFLLVCRKKKCIKKLYEQMEPSEDYESQEMFVKRVQWDPNEYQGRSFRKVRENTKMMDYTIMITVSFLFALAMVGAFSYFFNQ
jgi:ribosome-binding protein aMBF1 (putative translation factor)